MITPKNNIIVNIMKSTHILGPKGLVLKYITIKVIIMDMFADGGY